MTTNGGLQNREKQQYYSIWVLYVCAAPNLYVENHEILEATPALLVLTTINSGFDASRKRQWVDPSCREQGNLVGNFNQP